MRTNIVDGGRLWTIEEVAEYLAVPVTTRRYWRTLGRGLRCSRLGKHLRYRPGDVQARVDSQVSNL